MVLTDLPNTFLEYNLLWFFTGSNISINSHLILISNLINEQYCLQCIAFVYIAVTSRKTWQGGWGELIIYF